MHNLSKTFTIIHKASGAIDGFGRFLFDFYCSDWEVFMKHICVGVMAHVDAGKTTLLEAMLYRGGATRRLGRVDHQDAFLDTDEQERARADCRKSR